MRCFSNLKTRGHQMSSGSCLTYTPRLCYVILHICIRTCSNQVLLTLPGKSPFYSCHHDLVLSDRSFFLHRSLRRTYRQNENFYRVGWHENWLKWGVEVQVRTDDVPYDTMPVPTSQPAEPLSHSNCDSWRINTRKITTKPIWIKLL